MTNLRINTIFLGVVVCLTLLFSSSAQAAKKLIQPGKGVHNVKLGASRTAVHKLLGKPGEITRRRDGLIEDRWESRIKNPAGFHHYMLITFQRNKTIQIKLTSSEFETSQGYSVGTSLSAWRQLFKNMKEATYGYDNGPIAYASTYYDAVQSGIAFVQSERDDWEPGEPPEAIIVHQPGRRVIPLANYTIADE